MKESKNIYIETYGCQMNFSDSEIVGSIMLKSGFQIVDDENKADVIFINTCSIRDHAEQRIRKRLHELQHLKKKKPGLEIGILGCMAERIKNQLLEEEQLIDLIAGPDAYRDLPNLLQTVENGQKAINVLLSTEETYADINPVRLTSNGVSAFISIMTNEASIYLNSYMINDTGYIDFPIIGKIFVQNQTINQIKDKIQVAVDEYLKETNVQVKLVNFKITMLGQVVRPGKYYVYQDNINIFEALGLAGDATDFANRRKITLVRETDKGSEIHDFLLALHQTSINFRAFA